MENKNTYWDQVAEAAQFVQASCSTPPRVAVIIGSGLGALKGLLDSSEILAYKDIPFFPQATVAHHPAKLYVGDVQGLSVLFFDGRLHSYEGLSAREVAFPVYLAKQLGVETVIVTNSAGGLQESMAPGDVMLITDQINKTGQSPLVGDYDYRFGPHYPSMHEPYDKALQELIRGDVAHEGVYVGIVGPEMETPIEAKILGRQGADAIGMSTVLETIAAVQSGMKVLGLSVITDSAVSGGDEQVLPNAAKEAAQKASNTMIQLIKKLLKNYV